MAATVVSVRSNGYNQKKSDRQERYDPEILKQMITSHHGQTATAPLLLYIFPAEQ